MRCEGCPASPDHACYCLVANLRHLCRLKNLDSGLLILIADRSRPGVEPTAAKCDGVAFASAYDPRLVLVDLCPFLASCSCGDRRRCLQSGLPAIVGRADCLRCVEPGA